MATLVVPEGFVYVGPALLSTVVVLVGQYLTVSTYRKRAGIQYPQLYAEQAQVAASRDALLFNCAQRAHQNTLENLPIVYVTTLLVSSRYPIFAASACGVWSLSRFGYTRGYITGDPEKRVGPLYIMGTFATLGLLIGSFYTVGLSIFSGPGV